MNTPEAERERCRAWYAANRERKLAYQAAFYAANADAVRERTAVYFHTHREKAAAYNRAYRVRVAGTPWQRNRQTARDAVKHALERGELRRDTCSECGVEPAQAHHHRGYAPEFHLDVIWLCRAHHGRSHRTVAA